MSSIYDTPSANLDEPPSAGSQSLFYSMGIAKYLVLSILTFGIFNVYWFYKNFSYIKSLHKDDTWPVARAIFSVIFCYSLFLSVRIEIENNKIDSKYSAGTNAVIYILASVIGNLAPGIYGFVAFLAFIPIVITNNEITKLNMHINPNYQPNTKFYWHTWLLIVFGVLIIALMLLGLFLPEA